MATERSAVLFHTDNGRNATYQIQIEATDDGRFVVNYQFGATGTTLRPGTKTKQPVSLKDAEKIFSDLMKDKTSGGYKLAGVTTAAKTYQSKAVAKTASGLLPQLLNPIDEAQAERLIADDGWIMQEKADGHHQMARVQARNVTGSNRKGEIVSLATRIESGLADLLGSFPGSSVIDFEAVGDTAYAFDLLQLGDEDLRHLGAWERWQRLFPLLKGSKSVVPVRTAVGTDAKRRLFNQLKAERAEGTVFKRKDAAYAAGRPNSGGPFLKLKFVATATCVVMGQNGAKASVILGVLDGAKPVYIGKCTIPPNQEMPAKGSLIEVRYLYAYPGGSMVQAVYLGKRDDIDQPDTRQSLKLKAEESDGRPEPEPGSVTLKATSGMIEAAPQSRLTLEENDKLTAKRKAAKKQPAKVETPIEVAPAKPSNVVSIDRSAAAKKAWDTIRANREAAKQKAGQS